LKVTNLRKNFYRKYINQYQYINTRIDIKNKITLDFFLIFSRNTLAESKKSRIFAPAKPKGTIAQLVEQRTENPCVPGSIPGGTTI
jgi:hypothetical protein